MIRFVCDGCGRVEDRRRGDAHRGEWLVVTRAGAPRLHFCAVECLVNDHQPGFGGQARRAVAARFATMLRGIADELRAATETRTASDWLSVQRAKMAADALADEVTRLGG